MTSVDEIPTAHTPPGGYQGEMPPPVLAGCTDPLVAGAPDLRGVWKVIHVERESQKGMVIGKGGSILKQVGTLARAQLPEGTYLELRVKVDKDWQRRPERVERLGY